MIRLNFFDPIRCIGIVSAHNIKGLAIVLRRSMKRDAWVMGFAKLGEVTSAPRPAPTMALANVVRAWSTALLAFLLYLRRAIYSSITGGPFTSRIVQQSEKALNMSKYYKDDPAWADIEPLPQDDGALHPLAAIAYSDEYSEAMSYLRAVMAKNEFSDRVLDLTEHIISMNPAHYTVWCVAHRIRQEV